LIKIFNNPSAVESSGFSAGGIKYNTTSAENCLIHGKKSGGGGGIIIAKTKKVIIVGIYNPVANPLLVTNVVNIVVKMSNSLN